ncbi:HD domain-containing protein [Clostridium sp. YIM B02515]|uniref:HD domain-containing protein n=1 Tax=Clostridium rhizosphaerae TaxID=2803861 RepID=A0ABS1T4U7_9CLOT|nr:HD domain-containing protein [Clostridium rhizosphaerae]MBL4934349.1 HD domain-containing protein [Clostridium rhizosphaerae]
MTKICEFTLEMINFDAGEPELIQHFIKVHEFALLIGSMESVPYNIIEVIEAAAIVHDIGIKVCMEKYGECNGKLQEQEGPAYAEELLNRLGFRKELVERVSYLVAHHHTYSNIDGIDYQILVEADFLVNLFENQEGKENIQAVYNKIFKTESGRKLCRQMFMIKD